MYFFVQLTPKGFTQGLVLSVDKSVSHYKLIIKLNGKPLKTLFLNDVGNAIPETAFYDSLETENYIYKIEHNGSEQSKYFHESFLINKTQDSAIFQLENKSNYFKKNIGIKIDINNWLIENHAHIRKEMNKIKKMTIAYVFYSYCPSCVNRLISFDSLNKKNNSFHFFAVMLDSSKSVIRFYKRNKFAFHLAIKQEILCSTLPTACDQAPFFLLVDKSGEIIDCFDGDEKGIKKIGQLLE